MLDVALAVAAGGRALGKIPVGDSRDVLYLALEDGDRRLQARCRQLLHGKAIPARFTFLTRIVPGRVFDTIRAWLNRHPGDAPLVILDTLGKVLPPALPGESAYQRDYRIGSQLRQLCDGRAGLTLLTNHHDRKAAADDFVESVSGTHGLAGAADAILVLARDRHARDGVLKVTGRDVPEGEYAVTFTGAAWTLGGNDLAEATRTASQHRVTAGLGDRSAEVIGFVLGQPHGTRAADVATALGLSTATARTYLARAVGSGRLTRAARGLYTPVTNVTSVTSPQPGPRKRNSHNARNTTPRRHERTSQR